MVWQRVPKEVFVGKDVLEFGLFDAVANFNMGAQTVLQLYEALRIPAGKYTDDGCQSLDTEHTYKAVYKGQEHNKRKKVPREEKEKRKTKIFTSKKSEHETRIARKCWADICQARGSILLLTPGDLFSMTTTRFAVTRKICGNYFSHIPLHTPSVCVNPSCQLCVQKDTGLLS